MNEILDDFKSESKSLIVELGDLLDSIEGDLAQRKQLENYGQVVDRIMGGAKSLRVSLGEQAPVNLAGIGKYAELCKTVGYRGSQIGENQQFFDVVVALLQDATELLHEMIENLGTDLDKNIKDMLNHTFLHRLRWVSTQFDTVPQGQAQHKNPVQNEIDKLLKQLGI